MTTSGLSDSSGGWGSKDRHWDTESSFFLGYDAVLDHILQKSWLPGKIIG